MRFELPKMTDGMNELESYLIEHGMSGDVDSTRLLRDTAYERLRDAIRFSELPGGELLSEVRLSKILGISRTPIREALQQLAQEGLIEIIPGRAVIVPQLTLQDIRDVVHVRALLEPELARMVARAAALEAVETLQGVCSAMDAAATRDDRVAWSRADTRFHETLCDSCANQLLAKTVRQLVNRTHRVATSSKTTQARLIACTREHQAVVGAIAASDPEAAHRTMAEHIRLMQGNLLNEFGWQDAPSTVSEEAM